MDRHRPVGRGQRAGAVMVVGRVEAFEMDQRRPAIRVLRRHRHRAVAHAIPPGGGPAILARHDRDPLGPQREQLDHLPGGIAQYLHIAIAMHEQLRGQRFQQCLPGAGRPDQPQQPRIGRRQRRAANSFGDQPHGALRHRVFEEALPYGAGIIVREPGAAALDRPLPG